MDYTKKNGTSSGKGWFVRIMWKNKRYNKFFNDAKSGGEVSGLLCALAWRDSKKLKIGMPVSDCFQIGVCRSTTNKRGVHYYSKKNYYVASWCDANGRPNNAKVSATKHGKKKAFKMACAIRDKMEAWRLDGNVFQAHTEQVL